MSSKTKFLLLLALLAVSLACMQVSPTVPIQEKQAVLVAPDVLATNTSQPAVANIANNAIDDEISIYFVADFQCTSQVRTGFCKIIGIFIF